jgi:hypothetical protein
VGLPFSSTTSASGTVLFNVFVCRTIITHKTYLFHWVVKIVVMVCTLRILVFRNVLLVSGDWKSLHSTRWPSAYQRLKSTALEDVRLSRLAEVSLTFESALRSNRFEYCSFWRRRGAAVLQNTWYRLLSSQLEQGTFKILKSVLAGPQSVARFKIFFKCYFTWASSSEVFISTDQLFYLMLSARCQMETWKPELRHLCPKL